MNSKSTQNLSLNSNTGNNNYSNISMNKSYNNNNTSINNNLHQNQQQQHNSFQQFSSISKIDSMKDIHVKLVATNSEIKTNNKNLSIPNLPYQLHQGTQSHRTIAKVPSIKQLNKDIKTQRSSTSIENNNSIQTKDSVKQNTLTSIGQNSQTNLTNIDSYHEIKPKQPQFNFYQSSNNTTAASENSKNSNNFGQNNNYNINAIQKNFLEIPVEKLKKPNPSISVEDQPYTPRIKQCRTSRAREFQAQTPQVMQQKVKTEIKQNNSNNQIQYRQTEYVAHTASKGFEKQQNQDYFVSAQQQQQKKNHQIIQNNIQYNYNNECLKVQQQNKHHNTSATPMKTEPAQIQLYRQKVQQNEGDGEQQFDNPVPSHRQEIQQQQQWPPKPHKLLQNNNNQCDYHKVSKLDKQVKQFSHEKQHTIENKLKKSNFHSLSPFDQQLQYHESQYQCHVCDNELELCQEQEKWECQLCQERHSGTRKQPRLVCRRHQQLQYQQDQVVYCLQCAHILSQSKQLYRQIQQVILHVQEGQENIVQVFKCGQCRGMMGNFSHQIKQQKQQQSRCKCCGKFEEEAQEQSIFKLKCLQQGHGGEVLCGVCCLDLIKQLRLQ